MGKFYEFFAGGGMARQGLGPRWTCLFANDFDFKKGLTYQANFGSAELRIADIRTVGPGDLPGVAELMWGSFPCQDLSLAGTGAGLKGERSGTFYPFWDVVRALKAEGRSPKLVALENVCGTLTSHSGRDFEAICRTFAKAGYRCGALVSGALVYASTGDGSLQRYRLDGHEFAVAAIDLSQPWDTVHRSLLDLLHGLDGAPLQPEVHVGQALPSLI